MAGLTAIKRKGFRGGGMDASTSSFDKGATSKGPNPSREDRPGKTGNFQIENQGFTANQIANQIASNVSGKDFERAAERIKFQNRKTKEYPTYLPGGLAYKFGKNLLGTPKTKFGQRNIIKKRQAYINNIKDPKLRADMIKELGLGIDPIDNRYGDPTILGSGDYGKNLYGIDALDIINYNGDYMEQYGPKTIDGGGDGNPNILPQYAMMGGGADMGSVDAEPYNQFSYNEDAFGRGGESADVRRASYDFNEGGRAGGGIMGTRARKAFGGIMDRVTGRKAYGLGSIFKSIAKPFKSVAKAAGKVLKSDLGKAALLAAGAYYMPGYGIKATGGFGNMFAGAASGNPGFFSKAASGLGSLKNTFGLNKLSKDAGFGEKAMKFGKNFLLGYGLTKIPGLNKAKPNETSFSDRGERLKNSQGVEGSAAITNEIQEAYAEGDPVRIAQLQKYYNYMLPIPSAVQEIGLPSSAQKLPYEEFGEAGYRTTAATGGRMGYAEGGDEGGLMDLGGMEKDYRNDGGFVPIGEYEKKDDVPARLSVNEFVFTADAVRNAGEGDIDKGAEVMENMMKNLENGGTVSEESQGNTGAQDMFSVSQRLGEVI